jgi:hypothetical protein
MKKQNINVQNGTHENFGKEVGIEAAMNSDSMVNVTFYTSERDKFKTEFNAWSKKTAQATLEMCRVVYEAKKELVNQDFLKFCNEIGRKGEDATVRKYLKIGEKYEQFYQYAELLPNSWTSIYEITQLPSDVFGALVATDNSMANMTGDQIKLLMGKKTEDKSQAVDKTRSVESTSAVTTASTSTTTTAPDPSHASTEASESVDAASCKTDVSVAATASSVANKSDLSEFVTDSIALCTETTSDVSSGVSDRDFATQAMSTMLERVAATSSTTVVVEPHEVFEPYEITLCFNAKPSEDAIEALVESILKIKSKYRLDIEFKSQQDHVM